VTWRCRNHVLIHKGVIVSQVTYLAFLVFFLAALALRMRRELSFVRIGSRRFVIRLVTLPIVAVLVSIIVAMRSPSNLIMTWALSIALVVYSLQTTEYEKRSDGVWFRKNRWIGAAVLLLFVGRLVYRSWVLMRMPETALQSSDQVAEFWVSSPFSLMTLLLLTSYNALYYIAVKKNNSVKCP